MSFRVGDGETKEHKIFDQAFSKEMRKIYEKNPDHELIGYFYVESMMMLNPWKLWHTEGELKGKPKDGTIDIKETIEKFIKLN